MNSAWSDLLYYLKLAAGSDWDPVQPPPAEGRGFGYLQMADACVVSPSYFPPREFPDRPELQLPFDLLWPWEIGPFELTDGFGKPQPDPFHDASQSGANSVRIVVLNPGSEAMRGASVELHWAEAGTNLPYESAWKREGIRARSSDPRDGTNRLSLPSLEPGQSIQVEFSFSAPSPRGGAQGNRLISLMARLRNPSDPSTLADPSMFGAPVQRYTTMCNVLVREIRSGRGSRSGAGGASDASPDISLPFDVHGTADHDRLIVEAAGLQAEVVLEIPIQALPWRDLRVLKNLRSPRGPYGSRGGDDPLARESLTLEGDIIELRTDVAGASRLELREGTATIWAARGARLAIPSLHIARGVPMPARIRVRDPRLDGQRGLVRVAQFSAGRSTGGFTLELRPRPGVLARTWNRVRNAFGFLLGRRRRRPT
jgi:hypothetical protein